MKSWLEFFQKAFQYLCINASYITKASDIPYMSCLHNGDTTPTQVSYTHFRCLALETSTEAIFLFKDN